MKAMTYRGPFRIRLGEKPIPQIEHPDDAIVRVAEELGPEATAVKPGDRVLAPFNT